MIVYPTFNKSKYIYYPLYSSLSYVPMRFGGYFFLLILELVVDQLTNQTQ